MGANNLIACYKLFLWKSVRRFFEEESFQEFLFISSFQSKGGIEW
jgi:hypothetical protein